MKRKSLALLLALVLLVSIMPLTAYAETGSSLSDLFNITADDGGSSDEVDCPDSPFDGNHAGSYEKTATTHQFKCDYCDYSDLAEPHDQNGPGGSCSSCGYGCTHINKTLQKNQWSHWWECPDCYENIGYEEHEAGCPVCGYDPCAGDHSFGTEEYEKHVCQVCSYTTICVPGENCTCAVCGGPYHTWGYKDINAQGHTSYCQVCGQVGVTEAHYDWGDGYCDCGYAMSGGTGTGTVPGTGGHTPAGLDRVPKTGDASLPVFVVALLLGTAALLPLKKRIF